MLSQPGPLSSGPGWSFEFERDGFRAIVSTEDGLTVRSRRGWDMTSVLPELKGCRPASSSTDAAVREQISRMMRRHNSPT